MTIGFSTTANFDNLVLRKPVKGGGFVNNKFGGYLAFDPNDEAEVVSAVQ